MKALVFRQKGPAEQVLECTELELADLQPGELRVKMLASPINPADFMFIEKTYRVQPVFPQIAGFEGAGIIADNGGAADFPVNTLVAFRHKNAWAEYVNVPAHKLIRLPKEMPLEKAAQLSLNPLTAWALLEESGAGAGDWIILSAAASALSKLIIQLARKRAVQVLAIIRESDSATSLLDLGVSAVVTDKSEDLSNQILTITRGERIAGFLDAVGGELVSKLIKGLSVNSRIVHYGLFSDQPVTYHNADIIFKNLSIKGFGIDAWMQSKTAAELEAAWSDLIREISAPEFRMEVSGKFALEDYAHALAETRSGKGGKVLFRMDEAKGNHPSLR